MESRVTINDVPTREMGNLYLSLRFFEKREMDHCAPWKSVRPPPLGVKRWTMMDEKALDGGQTDQSGLNNGTTCIRTD